MAFPLVSARYPHPSNTVNTIGFGRLVMVLVRCKFVFSGLGAARPSVQKILLVLSTNVPPRPPCCSAPARCAVRRLLAPLPDVRKDSWRTDVRTSGNLSRMNLFCRLGVEQKEK